jgi:hypothetical protein
MSYRAHFGIQSSCTLRRPGAKDSSEAAPLSSEESPLSPSGER